MGIWKRMMGSLLLVACLIGCGGEEPVTELGPAKTVSYTVSVRTAGGMALEGVRVLSGGAEAVTDSDGRAVLVVPEGTKILTLEQVPLGYEVAQSYQLTGDLTQIFLTSDPISPENGSPMQLGLGDIMYDFTLETADGGRVTLSEELGERDVVLLQFWYSDCLYCARTFSALEVACSSYDGQVQVIAVDPLEDAQVVAEYQRSRRLSFPMAACPSSWRQVFGVNLYPATFVIDRYGMICLVHWGALTNTDQIRRILDAFVGDGYVQRGYGSVEELLGSGGSC